MRVEAPPVDRSRWLRGLVGHGLLLRQAAAESKFAGVAVAGGASSSKAL